MKPTFSKLLPLLFFCTATGLVSVTAQELGVVPAVQSWDAGQGLLETKGRSVALAAGIQATLAKDLTDAGLIAAKSEGSADVVITLDRAGRDLKPGGYAIEIGDKVILRGADLEGAFNGSRTLLQLLRHDSKLPKGTIIDWPGSPRRMLMLDVARKPFPLPVLKDYLRMMAWYKMNELHLHLSDEAFGGGYTGFRVESKKFPGLASKDLFYTKEDLRDLQDLAHSLGITITPEIDMPGHARCFTDYWPETALAGHPGYMDVTNPKTIERMKELLDEMIPIFDAPDFHIGTDEYRVGGGPRQVELHEGFRQFINTMNAYIRAKGKNTRIWSGFESMKGTTEIDPSVTIDMWETEDAKKQVELGHKVINSNQGYTYIVPGAHYYGVNNGGVYQSWLPWNISGNPANNPPKGDPAVLGSKLHVWNDQGPTGYTMTEIAGLAFPSMQAFAEKMWGTKGSPDYAMFQKRAAQTLPVPDVHVFDRLPAKTKEGLVFELPTERDLASADAKFPLMTGSRTDLEYPWTLVMEIKKTADSDKRGVILSSGLAEICSDFSRTEEHKSKDAAGKEVKTSTTRKGLSIVRACGTPGADPASSHIAKDLSGVCGDSPATNTWVKVAVTADKNRTTMFVNGVKAGDCNVQGLCPLAMLGSATGNSFVGKVRNLKVFDHTLSAKEIGRAAGLDVPDNLAAGCQATASASDSSHGFTPGMATDEDASTRWSSGPTGADQWLAVDLGCEKEFNTVGLSWESARAGEIQIEVSHDGKDWKQVAASKVESDATTVSFPMIKVRHVRIQMKHPTTSWGYSVFGIEVLKRAGR